MQTRQFQLSYPEKLQNCKSTLNQTEGQDFIDPSRARAPNLPPQYVGPGTLRQPGLRWSNHGIASDSSGLCSQSKHSAVLWGGDRSILLLNEAGSKGGNMTVAISITLFYSTAFTNTLQTLKWFLHISVALTGLFEALRHCISSELYRNYDQHLSVAPPAFSNHPQRKFWEYMMIPVGVLTCI